MQTASGAYTAAVTAQDQLVDYKVTVGFPGAVQASFQDVTACFVSVDIQQNVTSTLPDAATLISGYSSSMATLVLAGMLKQNPGVPLAEAQTIFWLFNSNDPTSPMYRLSKVGLSVTVQAGFWDGNSAADLVTKFTGTIDSVALSDGTVTLTCLDNRSLVTGQATLPPVITQPPYNGELTSEFAADYLLRHSSPGQFYTWPAQRPKCIFAVGMRSSIWPEVGTYTPGFTVFFDFAPGRYGTALTGSGSNAALPYNMAAPINPSDSFWMEGISGPGVEMFVNNAGTVTQQAVIVVLPASVSVYTITVAGQASAVWSIPITTPRYVAAQFTWPVGSTSVTGTIYVDGSSHAFSFTSLDARSASTTMPIANLYVDPSTPGSSVEGFQVTTETAGVSNGTFAPTAILDPSLNSLVALPDVAGKDTWGALQDLASAEAALAGFDELGVFHFVNRDTLTWKTSSRSITSLSSLATLDSLEQKSLLATHIQVPANPLFVGPLDFVWRSSSAIKIDGSNSVTFTAQTSTPVVNVKTPDGGFWPLTGGVSDHTTWRACTSQDGSGAAITSGITVTVVQPSTTVLVITVTNSNPFTVWLVQPVAYVSDLTPAGSPYLAINAQPVQSQGANPAAASMQLTSGVVADAQWPPVASGGAITNSAFGEVLLQIQANSWLQDTGAAQDIANHLLSDLRLPRPLYRNVTIVADPRLQLGDRVTILDPDVTQVSNDAFLLGIDTRLSSSEWSQTIDARSWYVPGLWRLGVAGYSELGTTTYIA
jgi:hypothetical protein